jgi:hypothetical protein
VRDEGVRERRRLWNAVRSERDDRRRLEDADSGRRGWEQVREAGRDHDQEPSHGREAEVEAEGEKPEREPEDDPGDCRQEEGEQPEPGAAQGDHALREVAHRGLDPPGREEGQARERREHDAHRALAVDPEDDNRGRDREREDDRQRGGGADPRDLRQPGHGDEEEQEQDEDVEDALEDDGPGSLDPRGPSKRAQRDDPGRVPGAEGEHAVQELAEDEGLGRRPDARPRLRGEHVPPAQHPDEEAEREQREGGHQIPVVALGERIRKLGKLDVPDCEIPEAERERCSQGHRGPARATAGACLVHDDSSAATQATS